MQNKRGSIFKPFAALKGFDEAIKEKEEIKYEKPILSEDKLEELQEKFMRISQGSLVYIKYYKNKKYLEVEGKVEKIDNVYRKIVLDTITIEINNILEIEILWKNAI